MLRKGKISVKGDPKKSWSGAVPVVLVVGAISMKRKELPFLLIACPVIRDQPDPL